MKKAQIIMTGKQGNEKQTNSFSNLSPVENFGNYINQWFKANNTIGKNNIESEKFMNRLEDLGNSYNHFF